MLKQGEPKSTDFLLTNLTSTCKPEQTTVRSGEARQESQASGGFKFIDGQKRRVILTNCKKCNKSFYIRKDKIKKGFGKFCSRKCYGNSKKGMTGWMKGKKLPRGKDHWLWKGGHCYNTEGYILIHKPNHPFVQSNNYVKEHRLIVEKQIGRYLKPEEVTHHLGAKDDNRPQMLMAFVNQSTHQCFERGSIVNPQNIIFDGRKLCKTLVG